MHTCENEIKCELQRKIIELEAQVKILFELVNSKLDENGPIKKWQPYGFMVALRTLTLKQAAVLQMLMRGWTNNKMSEHLDCSMSTTKTHIKSLVNKFKAESRTDLIALLAEGYEEISGSEFENSTGLPKDWLDRPDEYPEVTTKVREATR